MLVYQFPQMTPSKSLINLKEISTKIFKHNKMPNSTLFKLVSQTEQVDSRKQGKMHLAELTFLASLRNSTRKERTWEQKCRSLQRRQNHSLLKSCTQLGLIHLSLFWPINVHFLLGRITHKQKKGNKSRKKEKEKGLLTSFPKLSRQPNEIPNLKIPKNPNKILQ